jgi:hypothetical protein
MSPAGLEPAIPASERPQTLNRAPRRSVLTNNLHFSSKSIKELINVSLKSLESRACAALYSKRVPGSTCFEALPDYRLLLRVSSYHQFLQTISKKVSSKT